MANCNDYAKAHELDFYETPESAIRPLLPELGEPRRVLDLGCGTGAVGRVIASIKPRPSLVGIEIDVDRTKQAKESGAYSMVHRADALALTQHATIGDRFDLVISNPPYSHAMEFVQRGIELTRPGGITAMLLRLGWLASATRRDWHRENPADVFVLSERPSFCMSVSCKKCSWKASLPTGAERPKACGGQVWIEEDVERGGTVVLSRGRCDGKPSISMTDATDYAWFLWGLGRGGRWSVL